MRERELGLVGTARGEREVRAARVGPHLGSELEQFAADGLGCGIFEVVDGSWRREAVLQPWSCDARCFTAVAPFRWKLAIPGAARLTGEPQSFAGKACNLLRAVP
jgi:hypothetical protein